MAELQARLDNAAPTCRSDLLGQAELSPERDKWTAPASDKSVNGIYVDGICLVPAR